MECTFFCLRQVHSTVDSLLGIIHLTPLPCLADTDQTTLDDTRRAAPSRLFFRFLLFQQQQQPSVKGHERRMVRMTDDSD